MPRVLGFKEKHSRVVRVGDWRLINYDMTMVLTGLFLVGGEGAKVVTVSFLGKPYIEIPVEWARCGFFLPIPVVIPVRGEVKFGLVDIIEHDGKMIEEHCGSPATLYAAITEQRDVC